MIQERIRQGVYVKDIAAELGVHPRTVSRALKRGGSPPGEQRQKDWAKYRTLLAGRAQEVHFAVNTLGYSRRFHFVAMACEDAEHTYESLIQSFEYFGGVTGEVLVDNQKTEVISHRIGAAVEYNPRFLELAAHYGFQPRACRPRRARTKGKDERMVRYIKENFFVRYREFENLTHLNQLAEQWLREEADQRLHGTVKEVVAERFLREWPHLQALPAMRFDTAYRERRVVAWDGYIEMRGNRYSVPGELCGALVEVRIGLDGAVAVYNGEGQLVARHRLKSAADGWVLVPEHHRLLWEQALTVERRELAVYEEVAQWS